MLSIRIDNRHQHSHHFHQEGRLVLGRQPQEGENHVVIQDDYVSRRQLLVEGVSKERIRFENLGSNDIELEDGSRIPKGNAGEAELPAQIRIGYTLIRLEWQVQGSNPSASDRPEAVHDGYKTIHGSITGTSRKTIPLANLGDSPSPERLANWFETLLNVQRSAVGSTQFYHETVQALVDLVGLTRGMVLLRKNSDWKIVAAATEDDRSGIGFSSSVLKQIVENKQTYFGNPQNMDTRASLASLEAVVGAPIFDAKHYMVGVLYGSRDLNPAKGRMGISSLEAQIVQMLASSVSAGLVRQEMEEQLRQAQQLAAVGQALGFILHDLRGPLGNAHQLVEMLKSNETSHISREDQLEFIDDSVGISLNLLNDSLEFCRGQVHVEPKRGRFKDLFDRHLRLLRLSLDAYRVKLVVDAQAGLELTVDPDRMSRVFRNLAKNAAEALQGRENSTVTIGAKDLGNRTSLWVADNGPGLPPEVQANLFQPFATHGKKGGTGFGLAIAKQLVEAHKGSIEVSSSHEGTRFTISVPQVLVENDSTAETKSDSDRTSSERHNKVIGPLNFLVAEDVVMNQKLVKGLLTSRGHGITIVENGKQAIEACQSNRFDIVLMDIEMPVMDGIAAAREIRRLEKLTGKRIPIVALSGHEDAGKRRECIEAGMDYFLVKPIKLAKLEEYLSTIVSKSS